MKKSTLIYTASLLPALTFGSAKLLASIINKSESTTDAIASSPALYYPVITMLDYGFMASLILTPIIIIYATLKEAP